MDVGFPLTYTGPVIMPGTYTVDTLPAPNASNLGSYARVSDLFGSKTDLVLCSLSSGTYFWQPVRAFWPQTMSGDQTMTVTPLKNGSLLRLTGTLTASRTITLSKTNAWPGAQFEFAFDGALGIYSLTVAGLDLGATLSLVLGGRRRVYYDGANYQSF